MSYQHRVECEQLRHKLNAALKRAEAAEAERDRRIADYKHLVEQHMPRTSDGCDKGWSRVIEARELQTKLDAAEAKLAELEKQEPAYEMYTGQGWMKVSKEYYDGADRSRSTFRQVFTRPAPAINLAELVPEELPYPFGNFSLAEVSQCNACRAAIIRNIEEANK